MGEHSIPLVRIGYHREYTISATGQQSTGVWFPRYRIYKDGKPVSELRTSLIEPLQSEALAIDLAFDLAREDIRLGRIDPIAF